MLAGVGLLGRSVGQGSIIRQRAQGVLYNGTAFLERGGGLTGAADGDAFTLSAWFKFDADDTAQIIFRGASSRVFIQRNASGNTIRAAFRDSSSTTLWDTATTTGVTVASGWSHLLLSADLSATTGVVYLDDSASQSDATAPTSGNVDFTLTDWWIGSNDGGTTLDGDIAEVWFDLSYIDITSAANRRKFITAGGAPADLGLSGELPTGSSPLVYMRGPASNWGANAGTGGDYTAQSSTFSDSKTTPEL